MNLREKWTQVVYEFELYESTYMLIFLNWQSVDKCFNRLFHTVKRLTLFKIEIESLVLVLNCLFFSRIIRHIKRHLKIGGFTVMIYVF